MSCKLTRCVVSWVSSWTLSWRTCLNWFEMMVTTLSSHEFSKMFSLFSHLFTIFFSHMWASIFHNMFHICLFAKLVFRIVCSHAFKPGFQGSSIYIYIYICIYIYIMNTCVQCLHMFSIWHLLYAHAGSSHPRPHQVSPPTQPCSWLRGRPNNGLGNNRGVNTESW